MTTGTRLKARDIRLVARRTVATATRIVRLATFDRAGASPDNRKVICCTSIPRQVIVFNNPGIDHSATQLEGSNIRAQPDAFFVEGEAAVIASAVCWALHSSLAVTTVNFWDIVSTDETASFDLTSWRTNSVCNLTQDEVHQYRLRERP